ncbi:hypothetical protein LXT21_20190 [Myxococcus sp. K38C18041901]|uniref:hypothetical protein n=1 Tax=Myxococcus guangdongensis TaxID=2906760 RepID=UPI0020A7B65C|nr:hypothetical protein [Myxococcus guangdongensis]MCP3061104.1 hypothetical protein [Myxococcus guangdongensis]
MRALKSLSVLVSLLAWGVGCGPEATSFGAAELVIGSQQAAVSESEVTRIQVVVSGADFADITQALVKTDGVWGGTLQDIPSGTQRTFKVSAFGADDALLYEGRALGVTILAGQTVMIAITLQDMVTPQTPTNEVPVIDSVTVSSTVVEPGGVIQLGVTAHDPGDTLTYYWTTMGGELSSTSIPNPTWRAKSSLGTGYITLLVRDQRGAEVAVRFTITIAPPGQARGQASIQVSFNAAPVVSVQVNEARVLLGQSAFLRASVVDADGGPVTYRWTASCQGTFSAPTALVSDFKPTALPVAPCNNCLLTLTASDPFGGVRAASVNICVAATSMP